MTKKDQPAKIREALEAASRGMLCDCKTTECTGLFPASKCALRVAQSLAALDDGCSACDGEGEIYVGSSVPDDEGFDQCPVCQGSGKQPDNGEIAERTRKAQELEGDLMAMTFERDQWKERVSLDDGWIAVTGERVTSIEWPPKKYLIAYHDDRDGKKHVREATLIKGEFYIGQGSRMERILPYKYCELPPPPKDKSDG